MTNLPEKLRWNAKNSATASRLNMAMDQSEAADEIDRLRDALERIADRPWEQEVKEVARAALSDSARSIHKDKT